MLYHIAYVSAARDPLVPQLLADILDVSARNNARDGITGVLMYHDRTFFQILEGARDAVKSCYARICMDNRHSGVCLMWEHDVESRVFSDWAMGYAGPDQIKGYSGNTYQNLCHLIGTDAARPQTTTDTKSETNDVALGLARYMFHSFNRPAGAYI